MKVVILAGGLGSRLSEETTVRPKPMVEIGGLPILWHILRGYAHHGFNDFVLALGYKGEFIKDYFLRYRMLSSNLNVDLATGKCESSGEPAENWKLQLVDTGKDTLTGGRLDRLDSLLRPHGTFMLTYGDGVSNVDIRKLIEFHRKHGRLATVTAVRPPARFGTMEFDGDRVTEFKEKPQTEGGWINGGFFVFEPGIFDFLDGDKTVLEEKPLEQLARQGQLMAYKHVDFWQCMDTVRDKNRLEEVVANQPRAVENLGLMSDNFFKGKKVFVTGHTGFKGSWLAAWLTQKGAKVTGFALPPKTDRDHFVALGLARRIDHVEGDLRDHDQIHRAIQKAAPEIVFHLAAQPLVRLSYAEPKLTFDTNVGGAVNLLEAIRNCPSVRVLVFITSDKCYRNKEWAWGYRETDELGGPDSYSASKACAELVFSSYQESYFFKRPNFAAATARAGNVIGGSDWALDRIVPDCIRALEKREPIQVRNPEATRPWQHVLEPLSGYLLLALRLGSKDGQQYRGAWNFGPVKESNRTVQELVEKTLKIWRGGKAITGEKNPAALHEAKFLYLNCDKAHQELGWSPTWHFDEGLEKTVLWYRDWLKGADAWKLTTAQIRAYEKAAQKKLKP